MCCPGAAPAELSSVFEDPSSAVLTAAVLLCRRRRLGVDVSDSTSTSAPGSVRRSFRFAWCGCAC